MKPKRVTIGRGGRLVIPAEFRKGLGVRTGDQVVVDLKDGELRVPSTPWSSAPRPWSGAMCRGRSRWPTS